MSYPDEFTTFTIKRDKKDRITTESRTIPVGAPYTVELLHPILQVIPSDVVIPGLVEVAIAPGPSEYNVDYVASEISFNAAQAGATVLVSYTTRGDYYVASDINNPQAAIVRIEGTLGTNPAGAYGDVADRIAALEGSTLAIVVVGETPSGAIDGSNAVFTLAFTPISASEAIYVKGVRMKRGSGFDYTISSSTITFTAGAKPQPNDWILVDYRRMPT